MRRFVWGLGLALALVGCSGAGGADAGPSFQGAATPGTSAQECTVRSLDGPTYPDGGYTCGGGVSCNGPEDCSGGQGCCVTAHCGNISGYSASCTATCEALDTCPSTGTTGPQWKLCLSSADCPSGLSCVHAPFPTSSVLLSTNAGVCR